MATNNTITTLTSPKLTGYANIAEWDFYLHATLRSEDGLLKYLTETIPRPPESVPFLSFTSPMMETNIGEVDSWRRERARCIQVLLYSLEFKTISETLVNNGVPIHGYMMTCDAPPSTTDSSDPKALYTAVKECFPYRDEKATDTAIEEMEKMRQSDYNSLSEFMCRFRFLKRNLDELGVGRTEQAWNLLLVKKLDANERDIVSEVLLGIQEDRKPNPVVGKRKIKDVGKRQLGRIGQMLAEIDHDGGAGKKIRLDDSDGA